MKLYRFAKAGNREAYIVPEENSFIFMAESKENAQSIAERIVADMNGLYESFYGEDETSEPYFDETPPCVEEMPPNAILHIQSDFDDYGFYENEYKFEDYD